MVLIPVGRSTQNYIHINKVYLTFVIFNEVVKFGFGNSTACVFFILKYMKQKSIRLLTKEKEVTSYQNYNFFFSFQDIDLDEEDKIYLT